MLSDLRRVEMESPGVAIDAAIADAISTASTLKADPGAKSFFDDGVRNDMCVSEWHTQATVHAANALLRQRYAAETSNRGRRLWS